jgi:ABC-type amino acid transport system permease subunit
MGENAVFSGLDLVVILVVLFAFFYATGSGGKSEFTLEPLTLAVAAVVAGVAAVYLLRSRSPLDSSREGNSSAASYLDLTLEP